MAEIETAAIVDTPDVRIHVSEAEYNELTSKARLYDRSVEERSAAALKAKADAEQAEKAALVPPEAARMGVTPAIWADRTAKVGNAPLTAAELLVLSHESVGTGRDNGAFGASPAPFGGGRPAWGFGR